MTAIGSLSARTLAIPFKVSFAHASATRAAMQSLWIEAQDENGTTGYGEGCPREYVTGESLSGAQAFIAAQQGEIRGAVHDLGSLRAWVDHHRALIDANPAAWCAVELALLDLFGKRAGVPVESLLGLPALSGRFRYTAVIGDSAPQRFAAELDRYRRVGFRDFKIKLSGDPARDASKAAALRAAGIAPDRVRADANNLWRNVADATQALKAADFAFFALEEPLPAGDIAGMAALARALDCAIILDESAARADQLERLPAGVRWIINLRVSKMGGLLRSLALAAAARSAGAQIIVGAHVGETSVLTRAALTVVNAHRASVIAQEGAFGTHLLKRDVVDLPIMFGAGGELRADAVPTGAGFGLAPTLVRASEA